MVNRITGASARNRRAALSKEQNGLCYFCGCVMTPLKMPHDGNSKKTSITIEHLIPICEGGSNDVRNTVAACYKCNNMNCQRHQKGLQPLEPYFPDKAKPGHRWEPPRLNIIAGLPTEPHKKARARDKDKTYRLAQMQKELAPEFAPSR